MLEKFREVYGMLEDGISKDIYLKRLGYLVSGDYRYIKEIVEAYTRLPALAGRDISGLLRSLPESQPIVVYGAGRNAGKHISLLREDRRFIGFCDRDREKQERGYLGYPVMP